MKYTLGHITVESKEFDLPDDAKILFADRFIQGNCQKVSITYAVPILQKKEEIIGT